MKYKEFLEYLDQNGFKQFYECKIERDRSEDRGFMHYKDNVIVITDTYSDRVNSSDCHYTKLIGENNYAIGSGRFSTDSFGRKTFEGYTPTSHGLPKNVVSYGQIVHLFNNDFFLTKKVRKLLKSKDSTLEKLGLMIAQRQWQEFKQGLPKEIVGSFSSDNFSLSLIEEKYYKTYKTKDSVLTQRMQMFLNDLSAHITDRDSYKVLFDSLLHLLRAKKMTGYKDYLDRVLPNDLIDTVAGPHIDTLSLCTVIKKDNIVGYLLKNDDNFLTKISRTNERGVTHLEAMIYGDTSYMFTNVLELFLKYKKKDIITYFQQHPLNIENFKILNEQSSMLSFPLERLFDTIKVLDSASINWSPDKMRVLTQMYEVHNAPEILEYKVVTEKIMLSGTMAKNQKKSKFKL